MSCSFPGLSLAVLTFVSAVPQEPELHSGDVVLQTSRSKLSLPIREATHSPWSHTGLVEVAPDGTFVLEAVQPVSRTPWLEWRARGVGGQVRVLRLKGLDPERAARAVGWARRALGRPYDVLYAWGDDALYCSELVVKALEFGTGVRLGHFDRLDALDLSPESRQLAAQRKVPLSTEVVTPAALAQDARLELVFDGR